MSYHTSKCRYCGINFNPDSAEKQRVGGYINECPGCMVSLGRKDVPVYLAVHAGDGKMSDLTLLKFESDEERDSYHKMWKTNTGFYKGKSCQLGRGLTSSSGYNFEIVAEFRGNTNHKGKA